MTNILCKSDTIRTQVWTSLILALVSAKCIPLSSPFQSAAASEGQQPAAESKDDFGKSDDAIKLNVVDVEGMLAAVAKSKGKIVVVDVWSTSCVPCMREFPHLVELSKRWPDSVQCVSLNIDFIGLKNKPPESYTAKVQEFLIKQKAYIVNLLSKTPDEAVLKHFELPSIPAILIFGRDGKLHTKLTDDNTGDDGLTYTGDVIPSVEKLRAQL